MATIPSAGYTAKQPGKTFSNKFGSASSQFTHVTNDCAGRLRGLRVLHSSWNLHWLAISCLSTSGSIIPRLKTYRKNFLGMGRCYSMLSWDWVAWDMEYSPGVRIGRSSCAGCFQVFFSIAIPRVGSWPGVGHVVGRWGKGKYKYGVLPRVVLDFFSFLFELTYSISSVLSLILYTLL